MRTNTAPASLLASYAADIASFLVPFGLSLYGTREQYHTVELPCVPRSWLFRYVADLASLQTKKRPCQSRTEMNSSAESIRIKREGF